MASNIQSRLRLMGHAVTAGAYFSAAHAENGVPSRQILHFNHCVQVNRISNRLCNCERSVRSAMRPYVKFLCSLVV